MSDIFISYSRRDDVYVKKLAQFLWDSGFKVWVDTQIPSGEDWWKSIMQALRNCKAFIVVMSPNSEHSDYVQRELTIADQLKKPLFPILLEGDSNLVNSDAWSIFVRTQYEDLQSKNMPSQEFVNRLKLITNRSDSNLSQPYHNDIEYPRVTRIWVFEDEYWTNYYLDRKEVIITTGVYDIGDSDLLGSEEMLVEEGKAAYLPPAIPLRTNGFYVTDPSQDHSFPAYCIKFTPTGDVTMFHISTQISIKEMARMASENIQNNVNTSRYYVKAGVIEFMLEGVLHSGFATTHHVILNLENQKGMKQKSYYAFQQFE